MKALTRNFLVFLAFFGSMIVGSPIDAAQSIQIAAAASFTDVLNAKIIPAFTKKTGIQVLPTYGATGLLARQIENGAPYEVFIAADAATEKRLASENMIPLDTVHIFAIGRLVLWSKTEEVDKLGMGALSLPATTTIAVANPKTAPYGAASMEALTNSHLADTLSPKLVYADNINQAFQFAQTGNADIAFTAYALVKGGSGHTFLVPQSLYSPLEQSIGLTSSASKAAMQFQAYMLSKEAQKMLDDAGYLPPPKGK